MNDSGGDFYTSGQSPTTPAVVDSNVRPHGDMLKMMNPTPNGYDPVPNHKPKTDSLEPGKLHESKNNADHHKISADHVKKKDDESKHKHSSSHSKPKDSSKDSSGSSKKDGHDKEKKHSSSHSSKPKDSSHKHSDHSKHNSEKKEEKQKSDSPKKEHISSEGKPKTDNFKENEKVKDSSSKEHKEKHKEHKHKDKHKDKEHREKHKEKSSSSGDKPKEKSEKVKEKSDKPKDKSDKPKEKSDKPKEKSDKPKEKSDKEKEKSENSDKNKEKHKAESSEKHKEKHKEESSEKHKEKHKEESSEKHKEKHKDKHKEKHKDKHGEKHKDKHSDKHKEKSKEKNVELKNKEIKTEPLIIESMIEIKEEPIDADEVPEISLSSRKASMNASLSIKREAEESDDEPIASKIEKKIKTEKKKKKKPAVEDEDYEMEEEEEEIKPKKKRKNVSDDEEYETKKPSKKIKKEVKKEVKKEKSKVKTVPAPTASPTKRKKKEEEEKEEVWKWWEEEKLEGNQKWRTLEHNGPVFAPPYERVPKNCKFYYDGKHMELSELTEEVAGFYGRMLDHDYTSKEVFNTNFFKDWRKVMTPEEKESIKDLKKCNFNCFNDYYKMKSEERKAMTKEQKLVIKKQNEEATAKYGFCIIDGHKQKIGNFRIEPPGLFRGRGEHPKMGMLKRRIEAEDVLINIGKEAKVPDPPPGHKWKEVRHDNAVSWLASWSENILGSTKYVMLNPSSKLKGEKDWQKYETARKLKAHADRIREEYQRDFKSKEMKVRQRAVALYFIDKLALRAGNEKDEETADTVGCCSLRVEHITLDDEKDGQEYVVSFDFLGKDSIRYVNSVPVEKRAYKNLKLFMENKQPGDDLFDRLNTAILNKYLNDLMEGLTAKVFRTYNASKTLQEQLDLLTQEEMSIPEKILAYNRANRAVAILCNHQRAVPKGFSKAMDNLKTKIDDKMLQVKECKKEVKQAKQAAKEGGSNGRVLLEKKKKQLERLEEQLAKLELQATDREENKQIALGTSKLNYLDPRISVAWCKKWGVGIEKVYNRTQRDKFRWAIEMAGPDYKF